MIKGQRKKGLGEKKGEKEKKRKIRAKMYNKI